MEIVLQNLPFLLLVAVGLSAFTHILCLYLSRRIEPDADILKRSFKEHIFSRQYIGILLACTLLVGLCVEAFGMHLRASLAIGFGAALIALTVIDFKYQLLPNLVTFPLIISGVVVNSFGYFTTLEQSLWGAVAGYGSLWTVNFLFQVIRKKQGMGYGDFKLFAAIGAWLGVIYLPVVILVASILGILTAIVSALATKQSMSNPFPFGPALALAGFVMLLYGPSVWRLYLSFY